MVLANSSEQQDRQTTTPTAARKDPLKHMVESSLADFTPVRLRLLLLINAALSVLFALISAGTIAQHQHAMKTVGFDATPSVVAAHQISIGVQQMGVDLAAQMLAGNDHNEYQRLDEDFEKRRLDVSRQLVAAAKNITYGQSEQLPIENLQIAFGRLQALAQSIRDAHSAGKDAEAISTFRQANDIIESELLLNADALNKANAEALEATYSEEASQAALSCGLVLVVGLLLIASLFATQLYLRQKFRRRLNAPLLLSTLCLALFVQHLYSSLRSSGEDLRVAKEDSYNSIAVLLDARSNAYRSTLAQASWLLDTESAPKYNKIFDESTSKIARFANGHDIVRTISTAKQQLRSNEKFSLPGFSGLLAEEMNNIRFTGEADAALDALREYSGFYAVDSKMREAERAGDHPLAMRLGLGYTPDAGNYFFTRFDDALLRTLRINQEQFDKSIKDGLTKLNGLTYISMIVSLLVLLCIYLGLRPRMAEYVHQ